MVRIFLTGNSLISLSQIIMIQTNGPHSSNALAQNMLCSHQSIMMVFVYGLASKVEDIILLVEQQAEIYWETLIDL